jgi:hypothetical protein
MFIPKLHIYYAFPLDQERRQLFKTKNIESYPSIEAVKAMTQEWRIIWNDVNHDDKVFKLIIETLGVTVPRDLELYVYGAGLGCMGMSFPLIMPIFFREEARTREQFISTIVHEILHRFVYSGDNLGLLAFYSAIQTQWEKEDIETRNHIIVYAVLQKILPGLVSNEECNQHLQTYPRALDIVNEVGSDKLIEQFRSFLK